MGDTKEATEGAANFEDEKAIQETIAKAMAKAEVVINVVVKAFRVGSTLVAGLED